MNNNNTNIIESEGRIIFDPMPLMGTNDMFKPFWAIVIIPGGIGNYYRWLLEKNYGLVSWTSIIDNETKIMDKHLGLKLQKPAWGAHISFIRGESFNTPYYKITKGTKQFFREFPLLKKKKNFNTDLVYQYLFANNFITQNDLETWFEFKKKWDRKIIKFEYDLDPRTSGKHWWLKVKADGLKDIRQNMGFSREGFWGLHLTLGNSTPNTIEYSKNIQKRYEIN